MAFVEGTGRIQFIFASPGPVQFLTHSSHWINICELSEPVKRQKGVRKNAS